MKEIELLEYKHLERVKYHFLDNFEYYKPALTYYIYILHKNASTEIYSILFICMPNGALYKKYGDKILLTVKTRNSVRYDFKKEPRFLILSYMKKEPLFRTIFLYKNPNYTQQDLIGISEKKYSILVFRENV